MLKDLIEQRTAALERMKAAQDGDGEAFTAAENEVRDLNEKIRRAKAIDAEDRADLGTPITGSGDEQLSRELRSFSIARMIAHHCGMAVDAGREIELQSELAKRAGGPAKGFFVPTEVFEKRVITTGTAGAVAPDTFRPDLFTNALTATAVITKLGATTLSGLTGDVVIPRETDSPNVGWVAENVGAAD